MFRSLAPKAEFIASLESADIALFVSILMVRLSVEFRKGLEITFTFGGIPSGDELFLLLQHLLKLRLILRNLHHLSHRITS